MIFADQRGKYALMFRSAIDAVRRISTMWFSPRLPVNITLDFYVSVLVEYEFNRG